MKIEKINFNKIKVTFSPEDLIEHNLTPQAVKENSPRVQKVLVNIVRRAQEEMGFTADNARLMVEAMPGENDSMVMYITKLADDEDLNDALNAVKRKIRLKVRSAEQSMPKNIVVSFEDFEDALRLASFADNVENGELYFFNQKYHLIALTPDANRFSEFGNISTDENLCSMIREHGKKVCDSALATLREYF